MGNEDNQNSGTQAVDFKHGAMINGRFRVIKLLGRGGMGAAYLVSDSANNELEIVLKVLQHTTTSGEQDTLRHEFSVLSRLHHPNLVKVLDYGRFEKGQGHFFTMEYVPGQSIRTVSKNISIDELTELAAQILRALEYVHSSGLIHGDIKDENLLITKDKEGHYIAKLMDFGLAEQTQTDANEKVGGTLQYIAPERLHGAPPSPAVDLYAFGVLMYECLSGTLPFTGTAEEITEGHLNKMPTRLIQLNPKIPEIWDVIVARLLAKNPKDRYKSCHDVQTDLQRHGNLQVKDYHLLGSRILDTYSTMRASDVDTIVHSILQAVGKTWVKQEGSITRFHALSGEEGCGKDQIMDQIRNYLQVEDIDVFEAACNPTLGSPYRPILDAFSTYHDLFERLSSLINSEQINITTATVGKETKSGSKAERDPELVELRLREAISTSISDYAKNTTIVLILRDLEFADESTLELVFLLCRVLENFCLLASVNLNRASEYSQRVFQNKKQTLGNIFELNFYPLSTQEIESLLTSSLKQPQIQARFFDELHQHSGGNLTAIVEIIVELAKSGVLSRVQDTWTLGEDFDLRSIVPAGLKNLLQSTITSFTENEKIVTNLLAVNGGPMEEVRLAKLLSVEMYNLNSVLESLIQNRILVQRVTGETVSYDFTMKSLRDEIYKSIPSAVKEDGHRVIALNLQALKDKGVAVSLEQLAYHFLSAREIKIGLPYASIAITNLRRVHSNVQALYLCELANKMLIREEDRHRRPFLHKMAEIESLLGENEKALESFNQLTSMYNQGRPQSLLLRRIGEVQQKLGDVQQAQNSYRQALEQIPKNDKVGKALIIKDLVWAYIHFGEYEKAIESGMEGLDGLDIQHPSQPLTFLYNNLAIACFHNGQVKSAINYLGKNAEIKEAIGDERGLAATLNNLGIIQNIEGESEEALRQFEKSLEIRERIGDTKGLAETLNNMAVAFMAKGAYGRSWNFYRRSYDLRKRIGNVKGMIASLCNIGELEYLREDFSAAISSLQEGLSYARNVESRDDETELLYQLARVFLAVNQLGEATRKVDQSIQLAEALGQKSKLGRFALLKSQIYRENNEIIKAREWLEKAKKFIQQVSNEALEIDIELEEFHNMIDHEQVTKAPVVVKKTIVRAEKGGYKTAAIRGLTMLVESGLNEKSSSKEVENYLLKAKKIAEPMKLSLELKRILHLYGQVHIQRGEIRTAYEAYKDAYQYLKSMITSITQKDHQTSFLAKAENRKLLKDIKELQLLLKAQQRNQH